MNQCAAVGTPRDLSDLIWGRKKRHDLDSQPRTHHFCTVSQNGDLVSIYRASLHHGGQHDIILVTVTSNGACLVGMGVGVGSLIRASADLDRDDKSAHRAVTSRTLKRDEHDRERPDPTRSGPDVMS